MKRLSMIGLLLSFAMFSVWAFRPPSHSESGQERGPAFQTRGVHRVPIRLSVQDHVRLVSAEAMTLKTGYKGGSLTLVNVAPESIAAAVFIVSKSMGGTAHSVTTYFDSKLMPGLSTWGAGEPYTIDLREDVVSIEHGTPSGIQIDIDYIEFSDGSRFGKDKAGMRQRIEFERSGARKVLFRIRSLLEKEGEAGLFRLFEGAK